jgi:uncharacterized membrane protein (DUF441 family)
MVFIADGRVSAMAKIFDARMLTVGLIMLTAGLLGQYAAHGISLAQWISGLVAVAGSIALAVMVRVWPAAERTEDAEA